MVRPCVILNRNNFLIRAKLNDREQTDCEAMILVRDFVAVISSQSEVWARWLWG